MKLYPKKTHRNIFGNIIWNKDKVYEASLLGNNLNKDLYVVTCDFIITEYPILEMFEILEKFFLEEEIRENRIKNILDN